MRTLEDEGAQTSAAATGDGALDRGADAPQRTAARLARLAGALLLVMTVAAIFAEVGTRAAMFVAGDAHETATRILAAPEQFSLGFVGYLVAFLCDVPVAILFYALLRPFTRTWALTAAAFRLVYTAIVGAVLLHYAGALIVLQDPGLAALGVAQREALALSHLQLFDAGFHLSLVFFGVHLTLLGALLLRARLLPTALSALVTLGGVAYLVDNIAYFIAPAVKATLGPVLAALAMAEVLLALWLVAKGVRWRPPVGGRIRGA
ncbi:MAG: DUF4386 domain-containing protein [Myxococcales bacterium]|nr:DUF4386 domain-containing protein [Myxococcales bacterium]